MRLKVVITKNQANIAQARLWVFNELGEKFGQENIYERSIEVFDRVRGRIVSLVQLVIVADNPEVDMIKIDDEDLYQGEYAAYLEKAIQQNCTVQAQVIDS